jgi:hypothetical protein
MERKQHWEAVYTAKDERAVSWYEAAPMLSLRLIEAAGLKPGT